MSNIGYFWLGQVRFGCLTNERIGFVELGRLLFDGLLKIDTSHDTLCKI